MYPYYIGFPLLMLAAVIDASVLSFFRYDSGQFSLLLMLVVSWGLLNELPAAMPWAIIGGIFADLLSITPTGTSSLGYVMALAVLAYVFGIVEPRNRVFPFFAAMLATIILHGVVLVMLLVTGKGQPIFPALLHWTLPSMLMNAVGIIFVFTIMSRLVTFFRPSRVTL